MTRVITRKKDTLNLTWRKQLCFDNRYLNLFTGDANQLVNGEQNNRTEEEVVEERCLNQSPGSVEDHEDEEERVGVVCDPKRSVGIPSCILCPEYVDYEKLYCHQDSSDTWYLPMQY